MAKFGYTIQGLVAKVKDTVANGKFGQCVRNPCTCTCTCTCRSVILELNNTHRTRLWWCQSAHTCKVLRTYVHPCQLASPYALSLPSISVGPIHAPVVTTARILVQVEKRSTLGSTAAMPPNYVYSGISQTINDFQYLCQFTSFHDWVGCKSIIPTESLQCKRQ